MYKKLPISVLVLTKNEEASLPCCLGALKDFDEVIVVDSESTDRTAQIAKEYGVRVEQFTWNGAYPKKKQWSLDHIQTKHKMVFLVDADEVITPGLVTELQKTDLTAAGYFVRGRYVWQGKILKHGMMNNKLCLFDKTKMEFPVSDDLDLTGDWEVEMHYQPVLKEGYENEPVAQIQTPLLHEACGNKQNWLEKHQFYARWEAGMVLRNGFPADPSPQRERLKRLFRRLPLRGVIAFFYSYLFKLGFLDGFAGLDFALARARYYGMINAALSASSTASEKSSAAHAVRSGL